MGDAAKRNETCKSDHCEMGVADDPVGKVDESIDGHQRLYRSLQTHQQVGDDPKPDEAQRHVPPHGSAAPAQREQEVGDH